MAEWIAHSLVDLAAQDRISLLPKLAPTIICPLLLACPEGGPTVYTLIQCTPLLVEKAGVAPDVTLRFTACKEVSVQVGEPPWL